MSLSYDLGEHKLKVLEEELLGAKMLDEVFSKKGADQGMDAQWQLTRSGIVKVKRSAKVVRHLRARRRSEGGRTFLARCIA
jgi:uncharacterized protein YjaG (DUF416 family)